MQRGLDCLKRFAQLINGMPLGAVRIVGTNALREARNRHEFIVRAVDQLGKTLEAIKPALHGFFVELALFVDARS